MKNDDARQILSAYRPSGEDASDPIFEEALEQARRDPELEEWFKEERARDAALAQVFQSVPVPEEAKRSLVAASRMETVEKRGSMKRSLWTWTGALAACLAAGLILTFLFGSYLGPTPEVALYEEGSIGAPELLELAHSAMPLDFRGGSVPELRAWLTGRGAPEPARLPDGMASLSAVGCRVFSDDFGNAISLLCLKKDGELVHLFVAGGKAREALAMVERTWITEDGWNGYLWSESERTYVLFSKAPRAELEELVI